MQTSDGRGAESHKLTLIGSHFLVILGTLSGKWPAEGSNVSEDLVSGMGPTVGDYLRALRRYWWVAFAAFLLSLGGGIAYLGVAPKTFQAEADVFVTPTIGSQSSSVIGGRTSGALNMDSEAQIVVSVPVAERVKTILKYTGDATDLSGNVVITVPSNTSVLQILYTGDSTTSSAAGAQAFADAYLADRKASADESIKAGVGALQTQLVTSSKQLETAAGRVAQLPANSPDRAAAEAAVTLLTSQIGQLTNQLIPLQTTPITPGAILNPASQPTSPASPKTLIVVGSALVLGLMLAVLLVWLAFLFDKRIRRARDLERVGLVALAQVKTTELAAAGTEAAVSYGSARTTISASPVAPRRVLIAPVDQASDSSVVAANLATALARAGTPTVLVIATTGSRAAMVLQFDEASTKVTLSEALANPASAVSTPTNEPRLSILPAGDDLTSVRDLIAGPAMAEVLARISSAGDTLVIEAGILPDVPESLTLAATLDATVLVAATNRSKRQDVHTAAESVLSNGGVVLGAVLAPRRRSVTPAGQRA